MRICGRTTGVEDPIPAYHRTVAGDVHPDRGIAVEAVILDDVAATVADEIDADEEAADVAVANGGVQPGVGEDAVCGGADAGREAAELEVVAVDGDVVGVD